MHTCAHTHTSTHMHTHTQSNFLPVAMLLSASLDPCVLLIKAFGAASRSDLWPDITAGSRRFIPYLPTMPYSVRMTGWPGRVGSKAGQLDTEAETHLKQRGFSLTEETCASSLFIPLTPFCLSQWFRFVVAQITEQYRLLLSPYWNVVWMLDPTAGFRVSIFCEVRVGHSVEKIKVCVFTCMTLTLWGLKISIPHDNYMLSKVRL